MGWICLVAQCSIQLSLLSMSPLDRLMMNDIRLMMGQTSHILLHRYRHICNGGKIGQNLTFLNTTLWTSMCMSVQMTMNDETMAQNRTAQECEVRTKKGLFPIATIEPKCDGFYKYCDIPTSIRKRCLWRYALYPIGLDKNRQIDHYCIVQKMLGFPCWKVWWCIWYLEDERSLIWIVWTMYFGGSKVM